MIRGPASPSRLPPPSLPGKKLPLVTWESGSTIVRVHRRSNSPVHFSPGEGKPPAGRFDSASGRFGVLYAAQTFECAFAETILRNPARSLVSLREINSRAVSVLGINIALQLVDLTGGGLSQLGLDARFVSGPYELCGLWADALHDHPSQPGGIVYPSRFDPSEQCVALFSRTEPFVQAATDPVALSDMLRDVAGTLDRYGKALDPD